MKPFWRSIIGRLLLSLTLAAASAASGGTFKNIAIDGSFGDWVGVPLALEDPADAEDAADYRSIWVANDDQYLYVRFTLERPENPFTANDNIFIDADADVATGFALIIGSEMLIQGGAGYQERDGGFNEGSIDGLEWQAAPSGTGIEFEARISRAARFASDGTEVFQGNLIALLFESEDANFARKDTAPDGEGFSYEFAETPPALNGRVEVIPLAASWRYNSSGTEPVTDWSQLDYDDTQSGWASGAALLGYTADPSVYPIAVATALPTAPTSHYLRTRFTWGNEVGNGILVVSNYVSDGAVIYLNGTEVRRIRLPDGQITSTTSATGTPPVAGQAELFALPASLLVQGENVLAVELHQGTSTPDDLVFGLSLLASTDYPVSFLDAEEPADRAVLAGQSTTFSVPLLGSGPLAYQWLRNGEVIPDQTNAVFALDPVLPDSEGTYSLRVSSPATPAGVTSRGAVLTVLGSPVAITTQPASITLTEGRSATFSVEASGSAPLSYQWYKGTDEIEGATNATYTISSVTPADEGDYSVEVSNPAPSSQRSASAHLTVLNDEEAPAIGEVSGSPNRIVVVFSEPVEAASAQVVANYTLSGGATVASATLDASDASILVLTTTGQVLGTRYDLIVNNVKDLFGNTIAAGTTRSFVSKILVDGVFDDWAGIEQVVDDPADAENATDYAAAWIASDGDYIYLRVRLHQPSELGIFYNNIFLDADASAETGFGFRGIGSEVLLQGGGGYQQKNGGFNEGVIENLDWLMAPQGVGTEFELRFSRRARYATDGLPVFANPTIALFLESENTSFITVDVAPDAEPIVHELADAPPSDIGPVAIARSTGGIRISWEGDVRLQSTTTLTNPNWQDVPGAASPYDAAADGTTRFYRLAQ